ncbi:type IV pilus assembly protein PilW [Desulfonatronum thiosulfatophilum]|uniref:Type IV pilus assembly protein PilW n=1 Tax=Desulfonatronum thiosulfatophilum TaxID=617002 RepID=A0A1G6A2T7_9BACT|nr:PilW family protein [Desulfonatronum thiosulfatophilum]SDB02715.1 type IV pilus assembly protein PilW [Desulfonatronum thiosulfatophilum]
MAGILDTVRTMKVRSMRSVNQSQSGLSIVEALVTMVILMIVLGGVYQIFLSNSLTYRMQEGVSRLQENGRFAMDFLIRDIRMAGYIGCVSDVQQIKNVLKDKESYMYNFKESLYGYDADDSLQYPVEIREGTWSNDSNSAIPKLDVINKIKVNNILAGSDILTIRTAYDDGVSVTKDPSKKHTAATIHTVQNHPFKVADIILVSDCEAAAIFQVSSNPQSHSITHNTGTINTSYGKADPENETSNLGKSFNSGSFYWIATFTYFINLNSSGTSSLYRKRGSEPAQELVEGVESMQVLYGIDYNGNFNIDNYVTASDVGDWNSVRSVQIGLLMSTVDEIRGVDSDTAVYNVLGTMIGPANDMRLRRVFTTTIGLRNRLK